MPNRLRDACALLVIAMQVALFAKWDSTPFAFFYSLGISALLWLVGHAAELAGSKARAEVHAHYEAMEESDPLWHRNAELRERLDILTDENDRLRREARQGVLA